MPPGNAEDCTVRWRDSVDAYEDCNGKRYDGDELASYPLEQRDGSLYVDTRHASDRPADAASRRQSFLSGAHASSNRFSPTSRNRTTASALSPSPITSMITPSPNLS